MSQVIAAETLSDLRLQTALSTRGKLYELFVNCIPPTTILKQLALEMLPKVPEDIRAELCRYAAIFECKMNQGGNPIVHLEAFVLRVMSLCKKSMQ